MKTNRLPLMFLSLMLVFTTLLAACAPAETPAPTATSIPEATSSPEPVLNDIVDTAVADGRFTTLVAGLQAAELVDTLKGEGPFTVFAPTDEAFAALPAGTLDELLKPENKQSLTDILLYHVVPGNVMAADVAAMTSATTVLGQDVAIKVDMGDVYVNDAKVIVTDIQTSNGIIHVLDAVIMPAMDEAITEENNTIVDIAVADGRFTTLVAALEAAELVETLNGEGPFTVFAPTDDAFAAVGAVVNGMEDADGLAIERALPAGDIDDGLFRRGVLEGATPGLAEKRAEWLQMFVERGRLGGVTGEGDNSDEDSGEDSHGSEHGEWACV